MRLATPRGLVSVETRRWPLAGLDHAQTHSNGAAAISLLGSEFSGDPAATYAALYRSNPWVYSAVSIIARNVARLPLKVYELDVDGNRKRVRGDLPLPGRPSAGAALDNLLRRPEPGVSRREWLTKLMVDRLVYGNALAIVERDQGAVVGIWHVPWRKVAVKEGTDVPILFYEIRGDSWLGVSNLERQGIRIGGPLESTKGAIAVVPEDAIHFGRGGNVDSPMGLSPLAPLKFTLALHDALWRHLTSYFRNQARPSGLLKVNPQTSDEMKKKIREEIARLYSSPENAGKMMLTSAEWTPITDSPDHAKIVELARLSREEIVTTFGLAPTDAGIMDKGQFANVSSNRSRFVRDVLGGWAAEVEDDLNAQFIGRNDAWRSYFAEFDLGEMLRPDLEARAKTYADLRSVLTPNEMRRMENLTPLPHKSADTVWFPSGQVALGMEPPKPAGVPAPPSPPAPEDGPEGDAGELEEIDK